MGEQKSGSIINISSMAARSSISRVPLYSVAKSGVEIFTKFLLMEDLVCFAVYKKISKNSISAQTEFLPVSFSLQWPQ
jgi:short-subunit dehydrogenase